MTTNSCFFNDKFNRKFPISLMALEIYGQLFGEEQPTEEELYTLTISLIKDYCGVDEPSDEDFVHFVQYVTKLSADTKDKKPPVKRKKPRSFGTSYEEYLHGINPDQMILIMTGYDYEQARYIYCELDREVSLAMVGNYVKGCLETNTIRMEASMYGFGGKYKNDRSGEQGRNYDMNTDEGVKALSNVKGFGQL